MTSMAEIVPANDADEEDMTEKDRAAQASKSGDQRVREK